MKAISPPVKIGVVGCGSIARSLHLPAIAALGDCLELVAVCDINESAARQAAEAYGVRCFNSFEKMLDADIEAVSVLTHAYNHHLLGAMAARAGKHVIVEKPISITLPCADYLIEACHQAGVILEVTENYPFMPNDALVNEIACSGAIGDVVAVFVCDDINGMTLDIGVHRFAQVCVPISAKPVRLSADFRLPKFGRPPQEITDRSFGDPYGDHWGRSTVEFDDGAVGICECFPLLRAAPVWANDYRRIVGTRGVITDDLWPNIFPSLPGGNLSLHLLADERWQAVPIERVTGKVGGKPVLDRLVAHTAPALIWENHLRSANFSAGQAEWASPASSEMWLIAEAQLYWGFARAVRSGGSPLYSAESGRRDLEMCIATYESGRRQAPVALPLLETTPHELKVHEDFAARYARDPLPA
jgi:predicted dehydrogenase